jgi:hypothetical protein
LFAKYDSEIRHEQDGTVDDLKTKQKLLASLVSHFEQNGERKPLLRLMTRQHSNAHDHDPVNIANATVEVEAVCVKQGTPS